MQLPAPWTVIGASPWHVSVQLEVSSQVTLQGEPVHVTLQLALCAQATVPPVPTEKRQLEARQTMFGPVVATTSQVAPSVQVASHVEPQLPLQLAPVQLR